MTLLDTVKRRLGVFYSETNKDTEIQGMVDSAITYFKGAGWNISAPDNVSPTAVEAIVLFCKMAQSTDAADFINHPVLISFIAQGRAEITEEVVV